jgi:peptidoglycan/xylan/chitin deacetylase (PgdA/CDA1 family)
LDALKASGAKATFFVVGNRVHDHAGLLRRMAAEGHQIGNHTWNHDMIHLMDEEDLRRSIQKTEDAIYQACQVKPVIMRPPGGTHSPASRQMLKEMGLPLILWSVDPKDWRSRNVESNLNYVLSHTWNGDIILMHDLYEATAAAVEIFLPELIARGFELVTVDELARRGSRPKPGTVYQRISYELTI